MSGAKRQRADANDALVASLRRQIETLEGENAALRSARRLLADEDRRLRALEAANKRLRAERRKFTDELSEHLTGIAVIAVTAATVSDDPMPAIIVLKALESAAKELGVELQ
jgi:hypothetical protein